MRDEDRQDARNKIMTDDPEVARAVGARHFNIRRFLCLQERRSEGFDRSPERVQQHNDTQ